MEFPPSSPVGWALAARIALALLVFHGSALGQPADLRITGVELKPDARLEVRFTPDEASYYRLLAGDAPGAISRPVAILLAGPASVPTAGAQGFFRVERRSRLEPLDSDGDGRDDVTELLGTTDPLTVDKPASGLTVFSSSPADGEEDVAVTREMVVRFDRPLAETPVFASSVLFAEAAGRVLLTRAEWSPDRTTATLFYLEPVPGGTRVQVTVDGDKLRDAAGKRVDADGDGIEGGVGLVRYATLQNQPIAGTVVVGRVYASELVPGSDTGTNALNRPLAGVTITVDGAEESARAVTDAQGSFRLTNAPAGRFFVHVDGRTAAGSQWPAGDYYPFVGKAWEAVAGRTNLAGGSGEVFLPLIRAGSLTPVNATELTTVTFPAGVVAANPALAGVEVRVPAGALFDDAGRRGGRVGIAPVPADRLPEPLPAGLRFPLVITIQTDGPMNFSRPVPVRFPNLPDPLTGVRLRAGAKTALWSFDHDKGYWEVVGPATVTADGNHVETDPGVGVLQPGWHGVQPGSSAEGGRLKKGCTENGRAILGAISVADLGGGWRQFSVQRGQHPGTVRWFSPEASPQNVSGDTVILKFCRPGDHAVRAVLAPECYESATQAAVVNIREEEVCQLSPLALGAQPLTAGTRVTFGPFRHPPGTVTWVAEGGSPAAGTGETFTTVFCEAGTYTLTRTLRTECGRTCQVTDTLEVVDRTVPSYSGCFLETGFLESGALQVGSPIQFVAPPHVAGTLSWLALNAVTGQPDGVPSQGQGDEFVVVFNSPGEKRIVFTFRSDCGDVCEGFIARNIVAPAPGPGGSPAGMARLDPDSRETLHRVPGIDPEPSAVAVASLSPAAAGRGTASTHGDGDGEPDALRSTGLHYYLLENLDNGRVLRGRTGADGVAFPRPLVLAPDAAHRLTIVTADGSRWVRVEFRSAAMGARFAMPDLVLQPATGDPDGDGLPEVAEVVLGSNPALADTDGDGVSDGAEARAGTSPVGEDALPTGLLASTPLGGHAWDVVRDGDRLLLALGSGGVALFDLLIPQRPVLIGRGPTVGAALDVALRDGVAAVAMGAAGLGLVDLGSTPNLAVRTVGDLGTVTAVAVHERGVLAGTVSPSGQRYLRLVDPASGSVVARRELDRPVEDIVVAGSLAYLLTAHGDDGRVEIVRIDSGGLSGVDGYDIPTVKGAGGRRLRLVEAGDRLYSLNTDGFHVLRRLANGRLERVRRVITGQAGWRDFAVTSAGLLIAAADPVSTGEGAHDLQIHRLGADGLTPAFEFQVPTPGSAEAVTIREGLAYVADGASGLQVIRFQDADRAGRAPTVTLASSTGSAPVEENQPVTLRAEAVDDVAVARVEFLLDGQVVAVDETYPFEHAFPAPLITPARSSLRFEARATDTGGNAGTSAPLVLSLTADTSAPWLARAWPEPRSELDNRTEPVTALSLWMNEPFVPGSFRPEMFALAEAGPDERTGTADDVTVTGWVPEVDGASGTLRILLARPLLDGRYRVRFLKGIADARGNAVDFDDSWDFRIVGPQVVWNRPRNYGAWAGSVLRFRFSRPMDPATVAAAFTVVRPGPDALPFNSDDVPLAPLITLENDGTEAVVRFDPPVPAETENNGWPTTVYVRIARSARDLFGSRLKEEWSGYFYVNLLAGLDAGPIVLNGENRSILGSPLSGVDYQLEVPRAMTVTVENPRGVQVALLRFDGSVVAQDTALSFPVTFPAAGRYVLWISRPSDAVPELLDVKLVP